MKDIAEQEVIDLDDMDGLRLGEGAGRAADR